ncbi:GNAT family N-acetyltransferase [soil metagenome]
MDSTPPPATASYRFATESDIPAILALWQVAAENNSRPSDDEGKVRAVIERDSEALDLAIVGGQIVGSLIAGWDGWRGHLYRLAVHPASRRLSIGSQLLDRAEQRLTHLGASRIDAMVLDSNELGQTIWNAQGFSKQDDWRRWVRPL